jgi:hypothetical protein
MAVGEGIGLNSPRVSRIWQIRHHSAIVREIPPRSVRTYTILGNSGCKVRTGVIMTLKSVALQAISARNVIIKVIG